MIRVFRNVVPPQCVPGMMRFWMKAMRKWYQVRLPPSHGEKVIVMDILVLSSFLLGLLECRFEGSVISRHEGIFL